MKFVFHLRSRNLRRMTVVAALSLALLASASAGRKPKLENAPTIDTSKLVWPPPPLQPRVRFITQVTGELDMIGKVQNTKATFLERAAGVSIAPEERPKMIKPYGVAVDSLGRIYVSDTFSNKIFVFDLENKKLGFRGDKAPANLALPGGLAVDDQDRLFVADSASHQITCFEPNGRVEGVFGSKQLGRPSGVAVDNPLHRLYVADADKKRIAVFSTEEGFKFLRYMGDPKTDKTEEEGQLFTNPNSIAVDPDGLIYVTDAISARVVVLDPDGNFVRMFGKRGDGPGNFARPKGIAIDSDGNIWVADAQLHRLQALSPTGAPLMVLGGLGTRPGEFTVLAGLTIDKRHRILAVDQVSSRIEIFQYITEAEAEAEAAAAKKKAPAAKGAEAAKGAAKKDSPKK
jgi:DNA-binding beta-propeller fold protein YncE